MSDTTMTAAPIGGVLTPRMERSIRFGSVGAALVIAASAMVLSYAGLHDLALDAGIHPRLALLVPVMVDGLQFVGSLGVVYSTLAGLRAWYPWLLMLSGVAISAWGNWQAAPDALTAKLLHAAAPIILALVLEELLRVMRHKVTRHAQARAGGLAFEQASLRTEDQIVAGEPDSEAVGVTAGEDEDQAESQGALEAAAPPRPSLSREGTDASPTQTEATQTEATQTPVTGAAAPAATPTGPGEAPEPTAQSLVAPTGQSVEVSTPPVEVSPSVTRQGKASSAMSSGTTHQGMPRSVSVRPVVDDAPEDYATLLDGLPQDATVKDQVVRLLSRDPELTAATIARILERDPSHVRRVVRETRNAQQETDAAAPAPDGETGNVAAAEPVRQADPFLLGSSR